MGFDLVEQAWLPVVRLDGCAEAVGLRRLLREAHRLRRLLGETPPMTAALYRLVLALAHRVYGPGSPQQWGELWAGEAFAEEKLQAYFDRFGGRFDLFDEQRPFLQCPAVASAGRSSAAKLVPHLAAGNNTTLFDHTTADDEVLLDAAAAARWLVTLQAWDTGGLKTPYTKDKGSERGPCNSFGVVLVEGNNLKETLLLNMVLYDRDNGLPRTTTGPEDRPVWEAEHPPLPEPEPRRHPVGWTDLLTWPSRRVWLSRRADAAGSAVDKVVITPGVKLNQEGLFHFEEMAAFHRPRASKGAKTSSLTRFPVRLERRRGIWRHSQELLLASDGERLRPKTLDNLSDMVELGYVADDAVYTLRVFGQQLDSKGAVVQAAMEESVSAPVALLRADSSRVAVIIGLAVKLADDAGLALAEMEHDYRTRLGAKPIANLDLAYWSRLSSPFDTFIRSLGQVLHGVVSGLSEQHVAETWKAAVHKVAADAAAAWIAGIQPGRSMMAAGQVHGRFLGRLSSLESTYRSRVAAFVDKGSAA